MTDQRPDTSQPLTLVDELQAVRPLLRAMLAVLDDIAARHPELTAADAAEPIHAPRRLGSSVETAGGTASLTTTAAALTSNTRSTSVLVQAAPANTDDVLVGNVTVQPIRLIAGDSVVMSVANVNLVYAKSVSGTQSINWFSEYEN